MVNFVMDYMLTYFVCSAKNHKKSRLKCFICGLIGGTYGVLSLYIHMSILQKFIICFAMGFVTDRNSFYDTALSAILILMGSFICAGSITALSYICSSTYTFSLSDVNYIGILAGSFIGLHIFNKCLLVINGLTDAKENIIKAKITLCDKHTHIYLLNDSGNLLKSHSGKSIIIVDESVFSILCPDAESKNIHDDIGKVIGSLPDELQKRAGIMAAGSITGECSMLLLKVDGILLYGDSEMEISPAYVAFARVNDERFSGLINMNLISKEASK